MPPLDTQPQPEEVAPWWRRNLSLLLWTGGFAALALLVPSDVIERVQAVFDVEPVHTEAPFTPEAARLDEALAAGAPIEDRGSLKRRRHDVIIRRLVRHAGPLNGEEVRRIKLLLVEIDERAAQEERPAARAAWHVLRLKRLKEGYPRLSPHRTRQALEAFESQYAEALDPEK